MERKKTKAKDSVKQAKKRSRGQRRREEPTQTRKRRRPDQFEQMDGAESTYFEKG